MSDENIERMHISADSDSLILSKPKDSSISFKQKEPTWTSLGFEKFERKQLNLSANVFPAKKNEFKTVAIALGSVCCTPLKTIH